MQELTDNDPMPFGKYKGKPMIEVPAVYLLWLFNNGLESGSVRRYITSCMESLKKEVPKR